MQRAREKMEFGAASVLLNCTLLLTGHFKENIKALQVLISAWY